MSDKAMPLLENVKRFVRDVVNPMSVEFHKLGEGRAERFSYAPGQLELLEGAKDRAKAERLWDDIRFRDQIALLEIDIVALEMMVLRVLSAEKPEARARHRRPAEDPRQRDPAALH